MNLKGETQVIFGGSPANVDWKVIFLISCRLIWKWRCKYLFEAEFKLPSTPTTHILNHASNIVSSVRAIRSGARKMQYLISWSPLEKCWIKFNTDGSFKSSIFSTNCGGIIRDSCERWLFGFTTNLGKSCSMLAEV